MIWHIYRPDQSASLRSVIDCSLTSRYTAHEAHRIAIVNHVCQATMLEAFVNSYAETMAGNAPLSIVAAKRVIDEYVKDPEKRNQALADEAVAACFASEDYKEGRRAFMEKRKPVWTGR